MEFFIILGGLMELCDPSLEYNVSNLKTLSVLAAVGIALGVYAIVYVFKAIGLSTMARKAGKNKLVWCAFVPFASTYLMGELSDGMKIGQKKMKISLFALIAELLFVITWLMAQVPVMYAFMDPSRYILEVSKNGVWYVSGFTEKIPLAVYNIYKVGTVLEMIFYIVQTITFVFLLVAFFRVYSPATYIWMAVLCAFIPLATAFLIFAFRNRKAIDYEAYMRARVEQIQRVQQQQYGNPYNPYGGNPYGNPQNPYGNNPYVNPQNPYGAPQQGAPHGKEPDDPFGEYASGKKTDDDPFSDYGSGSDNKKD